MPPFVLQQDCDTHIILSCNLAIRVRWGSGKANSHLVVFYDRATPLNVTNKYTNYGCGCKKRSDNHVNRQSNVESFPNQSCDWTMMSLLRA
jgi:hypothetical protein